MDSETQRQFEAALKLAHDSGDVEGALAIAKDMSSAMRAQGIQAAPRFNIPSMAESIAEEAGSRSKPAQALAGSGTAVRLGAQGLQGLVGQENPQVIAEQQALRGATPYTKGGNVAGNVAMMAPIPVRAAGAAANAMGHAGAFGTGSRAGQVLDAAGTSAMIAGTTTPGDPWERMSAAAYGSAPVLGIGGAQAASAGVRRATTRQGSQIKVGENVRRELGDEKAQLMADRLRQQSPDAQTLGVNPTSAMVTQDPVLQVLESGSRTKRSDLWQQVDRDNAAARWHALKSQAGTPEELAAAIARREDATSALRNQGLSNANYGTTKTAELEGRIQDKNNAVISALQDKGRFSTTAAEQSSLANRFTPVEGQPRISGRYSENIERVPEALDAASAAARIEVQRKAERAFLERQLNSLQESGFSPLKASSISSKISNVLDTPGLRASDVAKKTLSDIQEKISSLAKDGNIDARDLYTVRKEIGNTISVHAKASGNWDKRLSSGLERDIQKNIDAAIEGAGAGDIWKQYLSQYQELSKPINSKSALREVVGSLERGLPEGEVPQSMGVSPAWKTVGNLRDRFGEKLFGSKVIDQLQPEDRRVLEALVTNLKSQADNMAAKGVLGSHTAPLLANAGRADTVTRRAVEGVAGHVPLGGMMASRLFDKFGRAAEEELAGLLQNPAALADALRRAGTAQSVATGTQKASAMAGGGIKEMR